MTDRVIQIGQITAVAGTRASGFLSVEGLGEDAAIPITVVNGARSGPVLSVTGGVHGGEYPGIDAAGKFADSLNPEEISGAVIVARLSNPTAFHARSVYICPLDGANLNRQFPGNREGTPSERIAAALFDNVISAGDAYIDLHGGDISEALSPFVAFHVSGRREVDARSEAMATHFGIRLIRKGDTPGSAYVSAAKAGIPSLLAESGDRGTLEREAVGVHLRGIRNVTKYLGLVPEGPEPCHDLFYVSRTSLIRSENKGLFYSEVELGEQVEAGQILGHINDYFGNMQEEIRSPMPGFVLYKLVSLAVNPGETLVSIAS